MTINNNTPSFDFFTLTPPNSSGDPFSKLATDVHGVPIGDKPDTAKIMSQFLGYSDKDTIGSALDEILDLVGQLNAATGVSMSDVQNYLNTLDPTQPNLPPIRALLIISERALEAGKIGGLQFSVQQATNPDADAAVISGQADVVAEQASDEAESEKTTAAASTVTGSEDEVDAKTRAANASALIATDIEAARDNVNTPTTNIHLSFNATGGNKWLAGNVYVAFLVEFMELQKILMQNKVVQGQVELQGMNLTVELAKTTADMIMDVAKTNQMIHIVTACMAAVSIVASAVALGMSAGGKLTFEQSTMITTMSSQLEKMTTAALQAATDITIAEKEGRKEVLQAYRTIAQHQTDKSSEAFKASTDAIISLLQVLDKIRDGLQQAVAASLRK